MKNKETGETQNMILKISEREEWLKNNPGWMQIITTAPRIVSGQGSLLSKTSDGWKEVLGRVKSGASKEHTIKD